MAENLTVNSPGSGSAQTISAQAPKEKAVDQGREELNKLKALAKRKLGRTLNDNQVERIMNRREARKAHKAQIAESKEAFEADQGKEVSGDKKAAAQTKAASATGAKGVKSVKDGLTPEDRQKVSSDPDSGPVLPPTSAKPATPEQAKKLVGKIFDILQTEDGKPFDVEAYSKSLRKMPPTKPKDAPNQAKNAGGPQQRGQPGTKTQLPGQQPQAKGQLAQPTAQPGSKAQAHAKAAPGQPQAKSGPGQPQAKSGPGQPQAQAGGQTQLGRSSGSLGAQGSAPGEAGQTGQTGKSTGPNAGQTPGQPRAKAGPGTRAPTAAQAGQMAGRAAAMPGPGGPALATRGPSLGRTASAMSAGTTPGVMASMASMASMSSGGGLSSARSGRMASSMMNAGGGLISDWDFATSMDFNWDGFFALFIIRSEQDLAAWKKAMRKLRQLSLQAELAGHDLGIALTEMRNQFKRLKASMDLGSEINKAMKEWDNYSDTKNVGEVAGNDPEKLAENDKDWFEAMQDESVPESKRNRMFLTEEEMSALPEDVQTKLRAIQEERNENGGPLARMGHMEVDIQALRAKQAQGPLSPEEAKVLEDLEAGQLETRATLLQELEDIPNDDDRMKMLMHRRDQYTTLARNQMASTHELRAMVDEAKALDPPNPEAVAAAEANLVSRYTEQAALFSVSEISGHIRDVRPPADSYDQHSLDMLQKQSGRGSAETAALINPEVARERITAIDDRIAEIDATDPAQRTPRASLERQELMQEKRLLKTGRLGPPLTDAVYERERSALPTNASGHVVPPTQTEVQAKLDDVAAKQQAVDSLNAIAPGARTQDHFTLLASAQGELRDAQATAQVYQNELELSVAKGEFNALFDTNGVATDGSGATKGDQSTWTEEIKVAHERVVVANSRQPAPPPSIGTDALGEDHPLITEANTARTELDAFFKDNQEALSDTDLLDDDGNFDRAKLPKELADQLTTLENNVANAEFRIGAANLGEARTRLASLRANPGEGKPDGLPDPVEAVRQESHLNSRRRGIFQFEEPTFSRQRQNAQAGDAMFRNRDDLNPSKFEQFLTKAAGTLNSASNLMESYINAPSSPWVREVDKAVGGAIGAARKQRKSTQGQLRQVVMQSRGMINQLIQVQAMGRAR